MKKYKLKQLYPGLPKDWKVGMEIEMRDNDIFGLYKPCNSKYTYMSILFANDYPEFWEEVREYDFEILKLSAIIGQPDNPISDEYKDGRIRWSSDDGSAWHDPYILLENKIHEIYQIRRKSGGEIFTIGDNIITKDTNDKFEINSFEIFRESIIVKGKPGISRLLHLIEHIKEPIFITKDGKDIYRGDEFWFVDNLWNIGKGVVTYQVFKPLQGYKQFSSKEAAEKYIEENKPLYSRKQVINILKGFDNKVNDYIASNKDYMEYINHYSDEKKGIFKYNSGMLALLCSKCSKIIKVGSEFTEEEMEACCGKSSSYIPPQYCEQCKSKIKKQ